MPLRRGFALVALMSWPGRRICVELRAVRSGSAKKPALAWNARAKPLTRSSPATRRRGTEPVFRAASRSTSLLLADLSGSSSDLRKGRTDGSTSIIWPSASGTYRLALVAKPSISSHIDG